MSADGRHDAPMSPTGASAHGRDIVPMEPHARECSRLRDGRPDEPHKGEEARPPTVKIDSKAR